MLYRSPFPELAPPQDENVHRLFFHRAEQVSWGNHTVHIDPVLGKTRGYQEFLSNLQDAATALGAPKLQGGLGLCGDNGDVIGIISENSMEYITLVQACLKITTPFAPISSYSTPFEFKHALTLIKPTHLFVHSKNLPIILLVAKETGFPLDKIYLINALSKGHQSFPDIINHVSRNKVPLVSMRPATKNTLAYLVLSSGTSGLPKAVMISHGNLTHSLEQGILFQKCNAEVYTPPIPQGAEGLPVSLGYLPFHHSYGLHAFCFRAFLIPSTVVILSQWDINLALKMIPKYKVSHLFLIPSVVLQILDHFKKQKTDLSSVISLGCGAAHLPLERQYDMEKLLSKEADFSQGYGMSETTIAAITQPFPGALNGRLKRIPGSMGVLLPGMEARVIREDGREANTDEIGELLLKGENIAQGYWNNEQATKEAFVNGWLRSGDYVRADSDGNFYYADRAKDILKISGAQVSPVEIEAVLLAHPNKLVSDVTVAGVSGGRTSDERIPRAWIVLSDNGRRIGEAAVTKELEAWHQTNLSKYKWLRGGIEVVDTIPKSPTGKTLRRLLQNQYELRKQKPRL